MDGTGERLHTALRETLRVRLGREAQPSAGIIDSQSAKTTEHGGPHSFDGGKTLSGCKRHRVVDNPGLVLTAVVHPAGLPDRLGAKLILPVLHVASPWLQHLWADQGDAGALQDWAKAHIGIDLEVVYSW